MSLVEFGYILIVCNTIIINVVWSCVFFNVIRSQQTITKLEILCYALLIHIVFLLNILTFLCRP